MAWKTHRYVEQDRKCEVSYQTDYLVFVEATHYAGTPVVALHYDGVSEPLVLRYKTIIQRDATYQAIKGHCK